MVGRCIKHVFQLFAGTITHCIHNNPLFHSNCLIKFHDQFIKLCLCNCIICMPYRDDRRRLGIQSSFILVPAA